MYGGIAVEFSKIEEVLNWDRSRNVTESFLKLTGYYRQFVENFSKITAPMTKLTITEVSFVWDDKCKEAFKELK